MSLNLLSSTSRVETPILYVTIGKYTFGVYNKNTHTIIDSTGVYREVNTLYPNFMKSITVDKINGAINTYTIQMIYAIRSGDDPNLLDKVFSSISKDRTIKITYGDASLPNYIYKEEEALLTSVRHNIDVQSSTISYTLSCTSKSLTMNAGKYNFGKYHMKPNDKIKEILYNENFGLLQIFYGMRDKDQVITNNLIQSDDKAVDIEAKSNITILDYLKYLVMCMTSDINPDNETLNTDRYALTIVDDISQIYGGPYFKISKIESNYKNISSTDIYDIEVGTHSKDKIISLNFDDDETYSILYNYSNKIKQPSYIYRINNEGLISYDYSPSLSNSSNLLKTTSADKTWWTTVTKYPISCTITIKGLLTPSILMSYVRLNVYFYGKRHMNSGLYIITKQTDNISESGCTTTLKLTRVGGADDN